MRLERPEPKAALALGKLLYAGRHGLPSGPGALGVEAQRATMRLQLIHIEDLETVRRKHLTRSQEGEVGEVLVIDRVELVALDQTQEVRDLDRGHTVGRQDDPKTADEVVEIRDMGHDVVCY